MSESLIPTERLYITLPPWIEPGSPEAAESTGNQIQAKAIALRDAGQRAWFEVVHPTLADPRTGLTAEQQAVREATFEAVDVAEDGTITMLPPYTVLLAGEPDPSYEE